MKLLHTSDWHLGMSLPLGTMADDQRYFFEQLYAILESENVDAVLCAGDVYDTGVANAEAIRLYNEAVTKICKEMHKKMIVIAGNHDSGARLAACNALLEEAGLYVSGKLQREIRPISLGNADIYPVPFFNRDEVTALFPEEKEHIHSQEDATQIVCNHIRENMDKSKVNVVVSHAYIVRAELCDSDRAAQVGFATAVSKEVFDGFDYVALGHIHKPQVISDTIRYSGSPLKYSFGTEESQTKQVVIFDTETKEQKVLPLKMRHDRRSLSGTYEEICQINDCENDYLKITVTDRIAGLALLTELRDKFPYLLELYGKSFDSTGAVSSISIDQLEKMDEITILKRFLEEEYNYTPSDSQMELFQEAVRKTAEGGENA